MDDSRLLTVFCTDGWWHAEGRDGYLGLYHQGAGRTREAAVRNCRAKIADWNGVKVAA